MLSGTDFFLLDSFRRCDRTHRSLRLTCARTASDVLLSSGIRVRNMLVDAEQIAPVAVVDWDTANRATRTSNHLAALLSYRIDPSDPSSRMKLLSGSVPIAGPPDRLQIAAVFRGVTGLLVGPTCGSIWGWPGCGSQSPGSSRILRYVWRSVHQSVLRGLRPAGSFIRTCTVDTMKEET